MSKVRLPRLLDSSLREVRRLNPVDGGLDLTAVPLSTASLDALTTDAPAEGSLVEMYSPSGSAGIYRVVSVAHKYGTELSTVEMEHGIAEVGNYLVNSEINESATLRAAIQKLWTYYRGSLWQLGYIACTDTVLTDVLYDNLLQAILDLMDQTSGYILAYDFTTSPWTVSVVAKDNTVTAEGRLSRNVQDAAVTIDRTNLCTRVYVDWDDQNAEDGIGTISMDADTIGTYGVIEKHLTGTGYTKSQAQIVAAAYLRKHKVPDVKANITGVDLANATGESLDRLEIGKLYRLAVPKYEAVIEENITGLSWRHLYTDPDSVEITLGEEEDRVVSFLHQTTESVSKSGKGTVKKQGQWWTKFERTNYYIDQVAAHTNENGNILQQAGMYIDASGVLQYAEDNEKNVGSKLKVEADRITSEVEARNQQGQALRSEIQQTATQIYQYVENEADDMRSEIRQTSSRIMLAVEKKSDNFYQFDDPRFAPVEGKTVSEGSIWVKSNDIRHYGDAEVFTWGDLGRYAWADFYGSEIYIWENGQWKLASNEQLENINRTRIDQTDEHIALIADSFDGNWSAFVVEAGRIRSEVNNIKSNMGSIVEQTAEMIRSAVFTANSTLYSEIKQTATQIYSHIEDENNRLHSEINQTVNSIRTEVGTKGRVFRQWTNPVYDDATRPDGYHVLAGDFWVVDNEIHTYGQAETKTYGQLSQFDWKSFYGCMFYVYDGSTWIKVSDDQLNEINHTYGDETREHFYRVAEDLAGNRAELELTKSSFRTNINSLRNDVGSSITQTARQIRSEVHAGQSTMYSEIRQTATNIMLHVADTKSGLESKIEVQKNRISLVVEDTNEGSKIKPASIVASINNGESDIVISADHVNLSGYVKASDLTADYLKTKIGMATQINTQRLNANTVTILPDGFQSSINVATGIKEVHISGPSSNTYKLQYKRYNQTSWQDAGSFSRAVSSWNVAGAGGKITVTASPQNQAREVLLKVDGSGSITSNGTYTFKAQYQNMSGQYVDTGASKSVTVNVSSSAGSISIDPVSGSSSASGTFARRISDLVASYNKYVIFTVNCTCGASHKYYIETPT